MVWVAVGDKESFSKEVHLLPGTGETLAWDDMLGHRGRKLQVVIECEPEGRHGLYDHEGKEIETDWACHPGGTLKEILADNHLSQHVAATALGVSEQYLSDVISSRRGISAQLAARLGGVFGPTPEFWLRLQAFYERDVARIRAKRKAAKGG